MNVSAFRAPRLARPDTPVPATTPEVGVALQRLWNRLDVGVSRIYGSRWNPLHQTGPLSVALMLVAIVTGVVLLLEYRVGAPYESMQRIQAQAWGLRWVRTLHRYVSDLVMLTVALHAIRMFVEGRTWGARVLAWISGVLLLLAMLVVGWTGYVIVWDQHGQMLGAAGARLMDAVGVLAVPVSRIFNSGAPPSASFMFLNLFVHMALPLGLAVLLWVHTARLARSRWMPERPLLWWSTAAVTAIALVWPAPLGPSGDGLDLGTRAAWDLFYTAWAPLSIGVPAGWSWGLAIVLLVVPLTVPAWWRPRKNAQGEPSHHNPAACTGCGQCVEDCPFEAIDMVPNTTGRGTHLEIASVDQSRCVSCGICAGSCEQLAIGPPSRDGHAQVFALRALATPGDLDTVALVACRRGEIGAALAARLIGAQVPAVVREVDCAGDLHALVIAQMAERHRAVMVLACPPHRCQAREGVELGLARILGGREPELKHPLDATRVRYVSGDLSDLNALEAQALACVREVGTREVRTVLQPGAHRSMTQRLLAAAATMVVMLGVAGMSQWEAGTTPTDGVVRFSWRLPGQTWTECRQLSEAEQRALPVHMRTTETCTTHYLEYRLQLWINGQEVTNRLVAPPGARGDRPLYVEQDVVLPPGTAQVRLRFVPERDPKQTGTALTFDEPVTIEAGRARLLTYDATTDRVILR